MSENFIYRKAMEFDATLTALRRQPGSMSQEPHTDENSLPILTPKPPEKLERSLSSTTLLNLFEMARGERRASPRHEVVLEWEEFSADGHYFRLTSDLSTFGLATRQGVPHPRGTRMRVVLHLLDGEQPLALEAEVLGPYNAEGGMRLAFRSPKVEAVRRIHTFLKKGREEA